MAYSFRRPDEPHVTVEREPVAGSCPECGGNDLRRYPVINERGWEMVVKCQDCLFAVERARWNRLGPIVPIVEALA